MTTDGTARVRIATVGRENVRAVLNGARQESKRASDETKKAAREAERAAQKAARETELAARRAGRAQETAAQKATRVREAEARKASRAEEREARRGAAAFEREHKKAQAAVVREAEKSARARARAEQRAQREMARQQSAAREGRFQMVGGAANNLVMGGMAAAGIGVGGVLAGLGATLNRVIGALNERAGVQSVEDAVVSSQDFERRSVQLGGRVFGEVGDERFNERVGEMRNRIADVARITNQEPGELLAALDTFHEKFDDFDFGVAALEELARTATTTGEPITDLVEVLGEARTQLEGISDADTGEFFGILAEQAEKGRITPAQFARTFAPGMAQYRTMSGRGGLRGLREFGALAQTQALGGGSAEEAATRTTEAMRLMQDSQTLQRLRRATRGRVRVQRDANGEIDMPALLEQMSGEGGLDTEQELSDVFRDTQGRAGIRTWLKQAREDRRLGRTSRLRDIQNVDAAAGQAQLQAGFGRVMQTADMQQKTAMMPERLAALGIGAERGRAQIDTMQAHSNLRQMMPVFGESVAAAAPTMGVLGSTRQSVMRSVLSSVVGGGVLGTLFPEQFGFAADLQERAEGALAPLAVSGAQAVERRYSPGLAQGQLSMAEARMAPKEQKPGGELRARTTMEPASVDHLARRIGEEVAARFPAGGDQPGSGNRRQPGGPARR